jgi:large subunit ribosomal protein L6
MSRIGKKPINIPDNVTVKLDGRQISVQGPKGELNYKVHDLVKLSLKDKAIIVSVVDTQDKVQRALWGTNRQIIENLITGVSQGYTKQLEIRGVGYRAEVKGDILVLSVGYSHPVEFKIPPGVSVKVEKNIITLESNDKQLLGEVAAKIRKIRKPEPYKGKGIKYIDEVILRKAGKQVKTAGG